MDARQLLLVGATIIASLSAPAVAQDTKEPYVRVAEIEIDPAQLDAYSAAVKEQIEAAVRSEPGVVALYSVADKENPAHVFVFEIYTDVDGLQGTPGDGSFQKVQGDHLGHGEVAQASGDGANPARCQVQVKSALSRSQLAGFWNASWISSRPLAHWSDRTLSRRPC